MAMRFLPVQNQILIVRKVQDISHVHLDKILFSIEIFDVPLDLSGAPLHVTPDPTGQVYIAVDALREVTITDHYIPTSNDESLNKQVFGSDTKPPHSISIFARAVNEHGTGGVYRYTIHPEKVEHTFPPTTSTSATSRLLSRSLPPFSNKQEVRYKYTLRQNAKFSLTYGPDDSVIRVLPGSYRSILYVVPKDDRTDTPRVLSMMGSCDEGYLKPPSPEQLSDPNYLDTAVLKALGFTMNEDSRMGAMAWDETIGRLCMVIEKGIKVFVLDFAKAPKEGEGFLPRLVRLSTY